MPEFTYEAVGGTGARTAGTVTASNEREAATILDSAVTAYGSCANVPVMLAGYTDRSGSVCPTATSRVISRIRSGERILPAIARKLVTTT